MIGRFLGALGRDSRNARVARARERAQQQEMPRVEQELPRRRVGKIAVRLLGEEEIAKLSGLAQERELILVAARGPEAGLHFTGIGEPQPRLAEKVEADVGLRDVLFEHRPMTDPFAQALRENERRVAEPQQVLEKLFVAGHDKSITPRGTIARSSRRS